MNKLTENIVSRMKDAALSGDNLPDEYVHAIELYCDTVLPEVLEMYGADDEAAINEAFNNFTDSLCKDGEISEDTYNSITFDFEDWDA